MTDQKQPQPSNRHNVEGSILTDLVVEKALKES